MYLGGIAALTLFINATTSGYVLNALQLVDNTTEDGSNTNISNIISIK